ncbi:unnamed protein product [Coffea canephora]|uniref:TCP domain-containing protein n=1 Tax=Coffea canephora TaxID=49390 RepID=A0A068TLA8_COFCA|nr:unnamed protein product [Coffea canephora]
MVTSPDLCFASSNEDDDENNKNEDKGYQYSHFYNQHFHQPDKSVGKSSIDIHQEKWPDLISSGQTLDPNHQHIKSAKFKGRMQDVSNQGSTRLKPKRAKGNSIEIPGGRIFRSTGRKDRHSKVGTARGPRDRRVRLSPNTAIEFYDVQDRLGYDRPSKAIDWLMKEAKAAIDALEHDSSYATTTNLDGCSILMQPRNPLPEKGLDVQEESRINCSESACRIDGQEYMNNDDTSINNFSFFSMENGVIPTTSSLGFYSYPHGGEINSETARCQRILAWNSNSSNAKGSQETLVNSELPLHFPSPFDQNQLLFHREPLQSSFSPIRGPTLDSQFPNLCFSSARFSSDGGLSELSAAARIPGPEKQKPVSSKPSSPTNLLHYQD